MSFFSKVFKGKNGDKIVAKTHDHIAPVKRTYTSSWSSKTVVLDEVGELIHACTQEMKARAEELDTPFVILPYRPDSATSSNPAKAFVQSFYQSNSDGDSRYTGPALQQELRLTETDVLFSILRWCWSRIPGGVVTWNVYHMFCLGEQDSDTARNAFNAFIPLSVDTPVRLQVILDFFDLLAAVAAHGKTNGLDGRKLSRMAGWWAFEFDDRKGFEGGYSSWTR